MSNKFTSTVAGASILITLIGVLSRGFGFLREVIYAAYFGVGSEFEIYLISAVFPVTINSVFLYLGQNFYIPIHSSVKKSGIQKERELFLNSIIIFFSSALILTIILFFSSNYLLSFYLPAASAQNLKIARIIFSLFILTIPINAAISIISAHLQALKQFARPAYAQLFANLAVLILVPLLSKYLGTIIIPIAYLVGSLLQMIFLLSKVWPILDLNYNKIINRKFNLSNFSPGANLIFIILIEFSGQFYLIIDRYFYTKVDQGGIAALNYALTVYYLPIAVLSVALSTAIFPTFAENLQLKLSDTFIKKVNDSIRVNVFLFAPIFIVYFYFGDIVIKLFFQRGNFLSDDTKLTYSSLQCYSLSLIFYSLFAIFNKIFYGARIIKELLIISIIGVIVKFIFNYTLVSTLRHDGLALSSSISYSFLCLAALFILTDKVKIELKKIFWQSITVYLVNVFISYLISLLIIQSFFNTNNSAIPLKIVLFILVYLLNTFLTKDYAVFLIKAVWTSYKKS